MSSSDGGGASTPPSLWSRIAARWRGKPAAGTEAAAHVSKSWESLAKHDPLWAIVSTPDKRGNRWGEDEFLDTGTVEVRHAFNFLAKLGITPATSAALDFGCGVGRLTQALAQRFGRVDGVDISPTMLDKARAMNRNGDRVRFVQGEPDRLPLPSANYDFVLSRIVLQHLPATMQSMYLREFMRVLKPGGVAVFQVVTSVRASEETIFRSPVDTGDGAATTIDMNILPTTAVEEAIRAGNGRVIDSMTDLGAGDPFESRVFVAVRG